MGLFYTFPERSILSIWLGMKQKKKKERKKVKVCRRVSKKYAALKIKIR